MKKKNLLTLMTQYGMSGLAVASFLFLSGMVESANAQVGGAAVVFLQIEPDSRASGMGNAGVALADNANATFWNPAGLAFQRGIEASITHSQWLPAFNADLFYDYLVGKYHVEGWGTFGAHVTFLNLGEHEWRGENNEPLGQFRAYDLAAGGSYGFMVNDNFALGTSLRLIYSNLASGVEVSGQETKPGFGVAFDAAGLYRLPDITLGTMDTELSFGFNLANVGPKIQYSDAPQADPIPTNLRIGWAYKLKFDEYNSLTFANDFNKLLIDKDTNGVAAPALQAIFTGWKPITINRGTQQDPEITSLNAFQQLTIGLGMEYWYDDLFALRTGYFYENPYNGNRQFLTFGAGIRYNILGVDFSYLYPLEENHPLANTMRFSLLLDFSRR